MIDNSTVEPAEPTVCIDLHNHVLELSFRGVLTQRPGMDVARARDQVRGGLGRVKQSEEFGEVVVF